MLSDCNANSVHEGVLLKKIVFYALLKRVEEFSNTVFVPYDAHVLINTHLIFQTDTDSIRKISLSISKRKINYGTLLYTLLTTDSSI